jgi:hypothetical protein
MDQRSIVLDLNRNGWMARFIHSDLIATFSEETIAYNMVANYLREAQISPGNPTTLSVTTSPHIDESDEAILSGLQELPFSSVRQLSRAAHRLKTTVYRRLSAKFGFTARHLRWV